MPTARVLVGFCRPQLSLGGPYGYPSRMSVDLGGVSAMLPMTPCSFHDDAPKDHRQVSLTAVQQRFEDISQEEVPVPPPPGPGQ